MLKSKEYLNNKHSMDGSSDSDIHSKVSCEDEVLLKVETLDACVPVSGRVSPDIVSQATPTPGKHLDQSDDYSSTEVKSIVSKNNGNICGKLDEPSFPFPSGLEMDPLAPTALAVPDFMDRIGSGLTLLRGHGKKVQKMMWKNNKVSLVKRPTKTTVNVILVEAKNLPNGFIEGESGLYCKFKLGTETHKSKPVARAKASWRERFKMHMYTDSNLEITMWNKAKQKIFMGRCLVDLSKLGKDITHDLWQNLECGHGSLHLLVTMSSTSVGDDEIPTSAVPSPEDSTEKYRWSQLYGSWSEVGRLTVTVKAASSLGLYNVKKIDSYCLVEMDNIRVQTQTIRGTPDPTWDKTFVMPIYDITSTLDVSIYDDSVMKSLLGKVSIPLLRIKNNEEKWYVLKDRSTKNVPRGSTAMIQLKMAIAWNPIKASVRLLTPKEVKYTEKTEKFNIPLIYYNLKFIRDIFNTIQYGNEQYKELLEWKNPRTNQIGLVVWLVFWFFYRQWMLPLFLAAPFIYYGAHHHEIIQPAEENTIDGDFVSLLEKDEKTIKNKLMKLQDLTFKIKGGIDFIVSIFEKLQNLVTFEVPYLSHLALLALFAMFIAFYFLPLNYLLMAFGIYKFSKKQLNPDRIPNNDLLDFLSRVPDNETLRQWEEAPQRLSRTSIKSTLTDK